MVSQVGDDTTDNKLRLQQAVRCFQKCAEREAEKFQAQGGTQTELCYLAKVDAINEAVVAYRQSGGSAGSLHLPALYLRATEPLTEDARRLLNSTSKSFELLLRFKEIERLDAMHTKLWELLSKDGNRSSVTLNDYVEVVKVFNALFSDKITDEPLDDGRLSADMANGAGSAESSRRPSTVGPSPRVTQQGTAPAAPLRAALGRSSAATRSEERMRVCLARESITLGEVMYVPIISPPRPTIGLFLSCPRNPFNPEAVDVAAISQRFAKYVSLVKSEAELIMWDVNNDGKLSEDEVENYVRDLVPRIAALREIPEEVIPFYCCTASRRIFWDLDTSNRGSVLIDELLQSAVMEEWVNLQLLTEDSPQNWFGATVTQQLYDKFLFLDARSEGTLNVDNLKRYKKGLPTVVDDGLPLDVSPLSNLFIDRYFETNVMMAKTEMDYRKFVDFVIAVELLPQCSRPALFWKILDLNGAGVLTPITVNYFYRETHARLVSAGLDVPSIEIVVQEVFDLIETAEPLRITRDEFIRSPQAGLFVSLIIDCLSFWTYENREQR